MKVDGPQRMKLDGNQKCVGSQKWVKLDGTQKCVGSQKWVEVDGPHKTKVNGPKMRGRSKNDVIGRFKRMLLQVG